MKGATGGVVAVLTTSFLWGTTGTAATFAPEAGPLAIGAAALGVGGVLQAAIALADLRRFRQGLRIHAGLVLAGAVAVAVYPLAFYSSMHLAGVAIGTVVSLASAPLASGLLERVVERKPLSRWWMLAALLGIGGSTLLCLSRTGQAGVSGTETVAGIGLGLVAGATYALYSWAVHRLMAHRVSRAAAMGSVFGAGGALLLPVLLITGAPLLASGQSFAVAAYMALVPMFLGYFLFGVGLTRLRPSTATTLTLTEPAVAALLAVVVVGEQLAALGWIGLSVLATALVVLALAPANTTGARPAAARSAAGRGNPAGTLPVTQRNPAEDAPAPLP